MITRRQFNRFNSRARRGRDDTVTGGRIDAQTQVSIHAPVGGATTASNFAFSRRFEGFNSRARRGRDDLALAANKALDTVSIHAPVGGATTRTLGEAYGQGCSFNSRARRGRDDQAISHTTTPSACFNSRARRGRDDLYDYFGFPTINVSIHAPVGGATTCGVTHSCVSATCFNSRARRGRDDLRETLNSRVSYQFQFTRP